ncbi:tetraspanin-9 [Drosophila nasuta]|uniref:tetraspanin-9 n=1 Tax=Drosophila nasuta TaxID=42062 RepID=UPI00295F264E|nr:tetraspanin-9 [Drosophila nasuta]
MACSTKLLKVFALICDIIYALLGIAVVLVGLHIIIQFEVFQSAGFITIAIGIVLLLTAIFGVLGASRESSRMVKSFTVILIVLIVLQVLTVGFLLIFRESLLISVDRRFDEIWHDQPLPVKPANSSQISSIETWLECCGNAGYQDYLLQPKSCYNPDSGKMNLEGCRQKFLDFIADRWVDSNIFALAVVGVEIICALLAYVLANSIVNRWRRSKYFPK